MLCNAILLCLYTQWATAVCESVGNKCVFVHRLHTSHSQFAAADVDAAAAHHIH